MSICIARFRETDTSDALMFLMSSTEMHFQVLLKVLGLDGQIVQ